MGIVRMDFSTKTVNVQPVMRAVTRALLQAPRTAMETVQMAISTEPVNVQPVMIAATHAWVQAPRIAMGTVQMDISTKMEHVVVNQKFSFLI